MAEPPNPPPVVPAPHVCAHQVLAAPLLMWFPANDLGKHLRMTQVLGTL